MSREEAVQLASRALALLMVVWALTTLTYLPVTLVGLIHHLRQGSILLPHDYWTNYYLAALISEIVRFLGQCLAAIWFWKYGPGVRSALFPARD